MTEKIEARTIATVLTRLLELTGCAIWPSPSVSTGPLVVVAVMLGILVVSPTSPGLWKKQPKEPCPTVIKLDEPPLAQSCWEPMPMTRTKRVPLVIATVKFKEVTPLRVLVVGLSEMELSGRVCARLDLLE
jgi:hypothetical protein